MIDRSFAAVSSAWEAIVTDSMDLEDSFWALAQTSSQGYLDRLALQSILREIHATRDLQVAALLTAVGVPEANLFDAIDAAYDWKTHCTN